MSHTVDMGLKVTNLEALANAARSLGGRLNQGQAKFQAYYGKQACDHAISFDNANYEIGVVKNGDEYELKCDFWGSGGLTEVVGQNGDLLKRDYQTEIVRMESFEQGHMLGEEEVDAESGIRYMFVEVPEE